MLLFALDLEGFRLGLEGCGVMVGGARELTQRRVLWHKSSKTVLRSSFDPSTSSVNVVPLGVLGVPPGVNFVPLGI